LSGGSLDYFYSTLEDHVGDFGDKELDDLVKDLATLFHDREWFLSDDTNEGHWNDARDAFKQKWFTKAGRKDRIENYLDQLKEEVLRSLGLTDAYCRNCKHWTLAKDGSDDFPYGDCDLPDNGCMMHRSETCERYERAENDK